MRTARVLFVCTGNICRSPTAEAVLRQMAEDAGLAARIVCDSAGTEDWHAGKAPDPRSVRAASMRGYHMVELRARLLEAADFAAFDLLIGMDSGHVERLAKMRPRGAQSQVAAFMSFAPDLIARYGDDVPDPFPGTEEDFEHALDLIEQGTQGLLAALRRDYL